MAAEAGNAVARDSPRCRQSPSLQPLDHFAAGQYHVVQFRGCGAGSPSVYGVGRLVVGRDDPWESV